LEQSNKLISGGKKVAEIGGAPAQSGVFEHACQAPEVQE
jgi:hypothetical protein